MLSPMSFGAAAMRANSLGVSGAAQLPGLTPALAVCIGRRNTVSNHLDQLKVQQLFAAGYRAYSAA